MARLLLGATLVVGALAMLASCGDSGGGGSTGHAGSDSGGEAGSADVGGGGSGGRKPTGTAGEGGDGAGGDPEPMGEGGAAGPLVLNPPDNVDVKACDSEHIGEGGAAGAPSSSPDTCSNCCFEGGYTSSTIYNDQCVCGTPANDTVSCKSTPPANCVSCCKDLGFSGSQYTFTTPGTCSCINKVDDTACASTVNSANPEPDCHVCCLNHGFLAAVYDPDAPACSCNF